VMGRLTDRFGARPVAIWSTLALGLSTAAIGLLTRQIWTYYALFALMSFVSVGTLPVVYGKIISLWFDRSRGFALGIALCTTGLAGMILPIYTQTIISHFGWRWAYVGVGLLPLLIALPTLWLLLPREEGPAPLLDANRQTPVLEGYAIGDALRHYRFWLIALGALVAGVGLGGVVFNFVPLLVDRGLTPMLAAKLFGLYGLTVVIGRVVSGWLLDRFWAPAVACGCLLTPALAALMLAVGGHAIPFLSVATCLFGLAGGAEFDLIAYLTSRYFGRLNFGSLYAGQYVAFVLGSGTAPALFGAVHDATGSYVSVLYLTAGLFAGAGLLILLLGRYPVFARDPPADADGLLLV
jgi:MFS family permease